MTIRSGSYRGNRERGVTLIELMIAIVLVSALAVGMLMAIRSGLTAMDRINVRLEENRRVVGIQQIVVSQIDGAIPLTGLCRLNGLADSLQLVTNYSIGGGARGFPQIVLFSVVPDPSGGFQLREVEAPYPRAACEADQVSSPGAPAPIAPTPAASPNAETLVLARHLYSARFSYRGPPRADGTIVNVWTDSWNLPVLPGAVRIETVPLDGPTSNLPALADNATIHVTKLQMDYVDDYQ